MVRAVFFASSHSVGFSEEDNDAKGLMVGEGGREGGRQAREGGRGSRREGSAEGGREGWGGEGEVEFHFFH